MRWLALSCTLLLAGCTAPAPPSSGHWGNRTDWHKPDWVQDYFADSDSHLVGWVEGSSANISFRAHCEDAQDSDRGVFVGAFETQEDAQAAVENNCPIALEKN